MSTVIAAKDRSLHWIYCPRCKGKTRIKAYPDTVFLNFPLYCPKCKAVTKIHMVQQKIVIMNEPDA